MNLNHQLELIPMETSGGGDECRCSCHTTEASRSAHIVPCCNPCQHCGRRIKSVHLSAHEGRCPVRPRLVESPDTGEECNCRCHDEGYVPNIFHFKCCMTCVYCGKRIRLQYAVTHVDKCRKESWDRTRNAVG